MSEQVARFAADPNIGPGVSDEPATRWKTLHERVGVAKKIES